MDRRDVTGSDLRLLRQKLRLTQEEFARELGMTISTVCRWENDKDRPSRLAWRVISAAAAKRGVTL